MGLAEDGLISGSIGAAKPSLKLLGIFDSTAIPPSACLDVFTCSRSPSSLYLAKPRVTFTWALAVSIASPALFSLRRNSVLARTKPDLTSSTSVMCKRTSISSARLPASAATYRKISLRVNMMPPLLIKPLVLAKDSLASSGQSRWSGLPMQRLISTGSENPSSCTIALTKADSTSWSM